MSEINRGIPEGVTHKATVINFEAAKEKRFAEKNRYTQWLQDRREQPVFKPVDIQSPVITRDVNTLEPKPDPEKQGRIIPPDPQTGEIPPPAESTNNIIDFQAWRENRLVNHQLIDSKTEETTENDLADRNREHSTTPVRNSEIPTAENAEDIEALREVRLRLAKLEVPTEKRDEILENLADDPKSMLKVAGVLRNITPRNIKMDVEQELERNAAFRDRILKAIQPNNTETQEQPKEQTLVVREDLDARGTKHRERNAKEKEVGR